MKLYFVPSKLPRSTTREEWKKMHRWCRATARELAKAEAIAIEALRDLNTFGYATIDITNYLVNPPLLLGPGMKEALHG